MKERHVYAKWEITLRGEFLIPPDGLGEANEPRDLMKVRLLARGAALAMPNVRLRADEQTVSYKVGDMDTRSWTEPIFPDEGAE